MTSPRSALVIGGGIAGISAAARLSADLQVTVLEQEPALGYHATGRSAALFEATYGKPTTVALNRAGAAFFHDGGYLSPRGLMLIAGAENDPEIFAQDAANMEMTPISVTEARGIVPILDPEGVTHAAYHDAAWDIDTDRLVQDFAKIVRSNGGTVEVSQTVTAITRTNTGWQVSTDTATFDADRVVNAAGPWADRIAAIAGARLLGLQPLRRSMARLSAPGGHDVSGWPMLLGTGETWYAKPDAGALLVSPAEEDPAEPMDAWPEDMVLAEGLARYQGFVTEEVTRPIATWAGLRTFAPDRNLVLGPDPDLPGFVWSAGQGGYGFQTAPAASQLVADLTLGRPPQLPDETVAALSPARFR